MARLETYRDVEAELAATATYRSARSVSLAKRRQDALIRKLDFAEQSDENGQTIRFNHQVVERQLEQVVEFIEQFETLSRAERLSNPSVLHADFSTFGQYGRG